MESFVYTIPLLSGSNDSSWKLLNDYRKLDKTI